MDEEPEFEKIGIDRNATHARAAEAALVGAVLRDGKSYERAREIVRLEHFSWTCYAWVWEACESLYVQGLGIDAITVGDELRRNGKIDGFSVDGSFGTVWRGPAAISALREQGQPRNITSYATIVQDYAIKRHILQFLNKGAGWAMNGRPAIDIVRDMTTEFSKIEIFGAADEHTVQINVGVSEAYDWMDRAAKGELVGLKTGITALDKILGSLFAGNFYVIAARPKQGKTGFLISVAKHVAKVMKKRVAIFSLEMSRMQVAMRLIAQEAEVDLDRLIKGEVADNEWPRVTHAVEVVGALPIVINDMSSIDVPKIRQTCRKLQAQGGLDLVIVDYLQLADTDKSIKYERRDLEVGSISRGLKHLAGELNIPLLAASQLNRGVEQRTDKRPVLSDLRESGAIEQDTDAVMFIYRPEYYENGKRPGEADIIVAAQRNGPVGTAEVQFQANLTAFRNLARDEPAANWQSRADMGDD